MEQKSLFDGIRDGKPTPNQPIATVVLPFNEVTEFNLPIVEKPWTNKEKIWKKLSELQHILKESKKKIELPVRFPYIMYVNQT